MIVSPCLDLSSDFFQRAVVLNNFRVVLNSIHSHHLVYSSPVAYQPLYHLKGVFHVMSIFTSPEITLEKWSDTSGNTYDVIRGLHALGLPPNGMLSSRSSFMGFTHTLEDSSRPTNEHQVLLVYPDRCIEVVLLEALEERGLFPKVVPNF